jgi:hypothetical protein
MTKTTRMFVDNIFLGIQKSGTKSRGDFTFCTATAILRCTVERGNIEQVINFKVKLKILGDVL